jgi:ATP-dependent DNA ligase
LTIANMRENGVRLQTRNGFDWTARYPHIRRGEMKRRRWRSSLVIGF